MGSQIQLGPRPRDIAWLWDAMVRRIVAVTRRNAIGVAFYLFLLYGAFIWVMVLTGQ